MIPYTLGADPEMFMADNIGALKASCGLIGGTKSMPQPLGCGEGFAVQEDNVAIEFNIPPAKSAQEFADNLQRAIKEIATGIKSMYGYEIINLSAASFPEDQLVATAAKEFGCDPDFNAWTGLKNPRPKADDPNLRSCGGHVHVGYDWKNYPFTREALIRALDLYLGVPSVLMDRGEKRKLLYGKAGAHRIKDAYGVEYRTLSNFWIFDNKYIDWVWKGVGRALSAVEGKHVEVDSQLAIQECIDNNDKALAEKLVKVYDLEVIH